MSPVVGTSSRAQTAFASNASAACAATGRRRRPSRSGRAPRGRRSPPRGRERVQRQRRPERAHAEATRRACRSAVACPAAARRPLRVRSSRSQAPAPRRRATARRARGDEPHARAGVGRQELGDLVARRRLRPEARLDEVARQAVGDDRACITHRQMQRRERGAVTRDAATEAVTDDRTLCGEHGRRVDGHLRAQHRALQERAGGGAEVAGHRSGATDVGLQDRARPSVQRTRPAVRSAPR